MLDGGCWTAVALLSFGVGETNCSQGKLAGELSEFQLPGFYSITSCKVTMNEAFPCEMILKFMEELKEHTIQWRIQTLSQGWGVGAVLFCCPAGFSSFCDFFFFFFAQNNGGALP